MTDRQMNCDLDGVFASRNQGQLISSQPVQNRMVRTPGLMPMRKDRGGNYAPSGRIPFDGYEMAPAYQGSAGWFEEETELPIVGKVSNTVLVGVAIVAFFALRK